MPSPLSWLAQTSAVATVTGISAFFVYTKHVKVGDFDAASDPLFRSAWYKKFNPRQNIPLADEAVRRVPLWKLRRDLVEDAEKGGSKLVESFTGGIYGGFGYAIQRKYLEQKYRNTTTTKDQLWDKNDILTSNYNPGTQITDHFGVLSKTSDTVLIRSGDSPLNSPDAPRASDGICEVTAKTDLERGFAEFRFRFLFFSGVGTNTDKKPLSEMGGVMDWLHKQYAALLVESALRNVLA